MSDINQDDDIEEMDDASEDEDETNATAQPYMALIKSLTEDSGAPSAKRRKLDHQQTPGDKADQQQQQAETGKEQPEDVDFVDEAEDAPEEADDDEEAEDGQDEDEDEETADSSDPFTRHFAAIDEAAISRRVQAIEEGKWSIKKVPSSSKSAKMVFNSPDTGHDKDQISIPPAILSATDLSLKHRLKESMTGKKAKFDALEQSLAPLVFGYRDVLFCNRNMANGKSVRRLACLHALNHVFKYVFCVFSLMVSLHLLTFSQNARSCHQK